MRADGSDEAEVLLTAENGQFPISWSRDGELLAFYEVNPLTRRDIWVLPLEGDREPTPFLVTPAGERAPMFSPYGRWLAYVSDESGRDEVYVRPYPGPGGRRQISPNGGTEPLWAPSGGVADGQRFLMVMNEQETAPSQLSVVFNWFEELEQRVPGER